MLKTKKRFRQAHAGLHYEKHGLDGWSFLTRSTQLILLVLWPTAIQHICVHILWPPTLKFDRYSPYCRVCVCHIETLMQCLVSNVKDLTSCNVPVLSLSDWFGCHCQCNANFSSFLIIIIISIIIIVVVRYIANQMLCMSWLYSMVWHVVITMHVEMSVFQLTAW